jgi:hypothetical protein
VDDDGREDRDQRERKQGRHVGEEADDHHRAESDLEPGPALRHRPRRPGRNDFEGEDRLQEDGTVGAQFSDACKQQDQPYGQPSQHRARLDNRMHRSPPQRSSSSRKPLQQTRKNQFPTRFKRR